jgi:hypothetical protein
MTQTEHRAYHRSYMRRSRVTHRIYRRNYVRVWRAANRERCREIDRKWRRKYREHRRRYERAWRLANRDACLARLLALRALRSGKLTRQPCEVAAIRSRNFITMTTQSRSRSVTYAAGIT